MGPSENKKCPKCGGKAVRIRGFIYKCQKCGLEIALIDR